MVRLTPKATSLMLEARRMQGADESHSPRLVDHEGRITLTFAREAGPRDSVVAAGSVAVYLTPEVAERLAAATLDARSDGEQMILVIKERLMSSSTSTRLH